MRTPAGGQNQIKLTTACACDSLCIHPSAIALYLHFVLLSVHISTSDPSCKYCLDEMRCKGRPVVLVDCYSVWISNKPYKCRIAQVISEPSVQIPYICLVHHFKLYVQIARVC
jgi:hypothetical protein